MRMVAVFLLLAALSACGGPKGRRVTAGEYLELERAADPAHQAEVPDDPFATPTGGVFDADAAPAKPSPSREVVGASGSTAGSRADASTPNAVEQQLAEVRARLRLLGIEHELAAEELRLAGQRADRQLRHAREDLAYFEARQLQHLLDEDAMQLAEADDQLAELREELAQLDALYGALQPEGLEAELVERLRRRVERAQQNRELAAERSRDLRERELPRQLEALRAGVEEAEFRALVVRRRGDAEAEQRELELTRLAEDERRLAVLLGG